MSRRPPSRRSPPRDGRRAASSPAPRRALAVARRFAAVLGVWALLAQTVFAPFAAAARPAGPLPFALALCAPGHTAPEPTDAGGRAASHDVCCPAPCAAGAPPPDPARVAPARVGELRDAPRAVWADAAPDAAAPRHSHDPRGPPVRG